jgi:hypothetical protein
MEVMAPVSLVVTGIVTAWLALVAALSATATGAPTPIVSVKTCALVTGVGVLLSAAEAVREKLPVCVATPEIVAPVVLVEYVRPTGKPVTVIAL